MCELLLVLLTDLPDRFVIALQDRKIKVRKQSFIITGSGKIENGTVNYPYWY